MAGQQLSGTPIYILKEGSEGLPDEMHRDQTSWLLRL